MLEQPAHEEMSAAQLLESLDGAPLPPRVPRASDGPLTRGRGAAPEYNAEQLQALLKSLSSMGYADGLEDDE